MPSRFRPTDRLRKQAEFDRVFEARRRAADSILIVYGVPNGLKSARLGLSVGRTVGNAVVRNRWKRLIREAFRLSRAELPAGIDFVVRPQKGAVPKFQSISQSLQKLAAKIAGMRTGPRAPKTTSQ